MDWRGWPSSNAPPWHRCWASASSPARRGTLPPHLFVDPPRRGLEPDALAAIESARPARIAYLSCDPATLARDVGQLAGTGAYELLWLQPIDFFPNTSHVECLAALRLR